jgi:hypothetical protein
MMPAGEGPPFPPDTRDELERALQLLGNVLPDRAIPTRARADRKEPGLLLARAFASLALLLIAAGGFLRSAQALRRPPGTSTRKEPAAGSRSYAARSTRRPAARERLAPTLTAAVGGTGQATEQRELAGVRSEETLGASPVRVPTTAWFAGGGPSVPTASVGYRTLGFAAFHLAYPIPLPHRSDWIADGFWEYQMEIPLYAVIQIKSAVAIGYTPIGFRYVTRAHRRVRPFVGGYAGMLFATSSVPEVGSRLNFSPQGEVGVEIGAGPRRAWQIEMRYVHISNAGLFHPNPGVNSLLFLLGRTL